MDLFREGRDLLFDDDPDSMKQAGFRRPTYAIGSDEVDVVHVNQVRKVYGHLTPDQKKRFKEWFDWDRE